MPPIRQSRRGALSARRRNSVHAGSRSVGDGPERTACSCTVTQQYVRRRARRDAQRALGPLEKVIAVPRRR